MLNTLHHLTQPSEQHVERGECTSFYTIFKTWRVTVSHTHIQENKTLLQTQHAIGIRALPAYNMVCYNGQKRSDADTDGAADGSCG